MMADVLLRGCCSATNSYRVVRLGVQEAGLARIMLEDIGYETIMKINRPAQPGDKLTVSVGYVDIPKGIFKFEESLTSSTDTLLDNDEDLLSDESEASDVSAETTYS